MYALFHKVNQKILHLDVMVDRSGCIQYHASDSGSIPLVHSTTSCLTQLLDQYEIYDYSYDYPCMDDVIVDDYEIKKLYVSYEEMIYAEE